MKNNKWLWISIGILVVFFVPLAMDWLIIGNSFPSNIDNADWVGFLGGYIGALIGAAISLIGIVITIRHTSEENRKDRELQVRPYCSIRYVQDKVMRGTSKVLGYIVWGCEPKDNKGPDYRAMLYVKNIGLGPAIEFDISVEDIDDGRDHYPILMQRTTETSNNATSVLQAGEDAAIPVIVEFNFDSIDPSQVTRCEDDNLGGFELSFDTLKKYKKFDVKITVRYRDIFDNVYAQRIVLKSSISALISKDGKAEYSGSLYLEEVSNPVRE